MKRLVIVTGVFYPHPSPTGKCVRQYAELLKDLYDISVVFIQTSKHGTNAVNIDGITLYSIFNLRLYLENLLIAKVKASKTTSWKNVFTFLVTIMKMLGRIQAFLMWPNNLRWIRGKAYKKLQELHSTKKIDCVLTINSPFPAHLAGMRFKKKHPEVKWLTYTVDPFTRAEKDKNAFIIPKLKERLDICAEKKVYYTADFNFVSEEVYSTDSQVFARALQKTEPLPYMLTEIHETDREYFPGDKINLLFAGKFYRTLRNPEYFFKTFLAVSNKNIVLHLYSTSDCESLVEDYVRKSCGRITRHALVGVEEIQRIMTKADILINLGNSTAAFKPSKTFEYISTGKPIINFYQNGLRDEVLDAYPLALQIGQNEQDISISAKMLEKFCIQNKGRHIGWKEIESLYPGYSRYSIKKLLAKGMETNSYCG